MTVSILNKFIKTKFIFFNRCSVFENEYCNILDKNVTQHSMNFYLIDKVKEIKIGKSASGIKCWSLDNQIFDALSGFPTVLVFY